MSRDDRDARDNDARLRRLTGGPTDASRRLASRQFDQRVRWGEFSPDGRDLR